MALALSLLPLERLTGSEFITVAALVLCCVGLFITTPRRPRRG